MTLYYFDVDDNGTLISDDDGIDCEGLTIEREATKALAEMMGERLPDGDCRQLSIIVRNEIGETVYYARIKFEAGALI
ncbi:hypothetical protein C7I87_35070 [Mesorhizobium sp. SARCC-RB16n]|uniref:DUF6894 family protein n=1 Tax=Mesorhizobium sp. SARCC-RB16n TaxID=2116687 RepID=UPI00122F472E|nr:hypothetical protein [Mesorhizobium sp. SARCC-RB16n]KAA3441424.1 hypothetical protein C7I87_35070 [Mesorhizobium sp. SARCC-RB16n]